MTKITGKTALITGASRGIGKAIALEFARQGAKRLLLLARDRQRLAEVASELALWGVDAVILPVDLTEPIAVNIAIAKAWRDHGPIHFLVNCAGVAYQTPFLQSQLSKVHEEMSLNFMGMFTITRLVAKRMAAQKEGTIINVSSLMGKIAAPTMSTYSATKFAILGFTQALRGELAPYNIKVVALLPTLTDTDMIQNIKRFRGVLPITPERVAKTLVSGLSKDKSEIIVGWQGHLAVWCQRLAPCLLDRVLSLANPYQLSVTSDQ
jgi:3-oxoacyl-[acyl-carrier protein] reductase